MDYKLIESLVLLSKNGDEEAKEKLVHEFKPLINKIITKAYIHGFDLNDLEHEGYITLFKCISMYNPENHRFVGYVYNAIKNNINYLIEKSIKRSSSEGPTALIMTDKLEHVLLSNEDLLDKKLSEIVDSDLFNIIFENLNEEQLEIINLIILQDYTIREYAEMKNMNYSTAVLRKRVALDKIKIPLLNYNTFSAKI